MDKNATIVAGLEALALLILSGQAMDGFESDLVQPRHVWGEPPLTLSMMGDPHYLPSDLGLKLPLIRCSPLRLLAIVSGEPGSLVRD